MGKKTVHVVDRIIHKRKVRIRISCDIGAWSVANSFRIILAENR